MLQFSKMLLADVNVFCFYISAVGGWCGDMLLEKCCFPCWVSFDVSFNFKKAQAQVKCALRINF